MPTAIILAGPNGAGKTTFASAWFRQQPGPIVFVNADEIARELDPALTGAARDLRAGRLMLERMDNVVGRLGDFVVENTLSSTLYARRIEHWRDLGYRTALIYIRLVSVEESLSRVARRAAAGGHSVPETDLRRRFSRSLNLLETVYKPLVDDWRVFDSTEGRFDLGGLERSMSEVLDTQRLNRATEDAAKALAAGGPKVRAGQFDPAAVLCSNEAEAEMSDRFKAGGGEIYVPAE